MIGGFSDFNLSFAVITGGKCQLVTEKIKAVTTLRSENGLKSYLPALWQCINKIMQ